VRTLTLTQLRHTLHASTLRAVREARDSSALKRMASGIANRLDGGVSAPILSTPAVEQSAVPQVRSTVVSSSTAFATDKALQLQIQKEIAAAGVAPSGLWRKRVWVARRSMRIWVFLVRVVFKIFKLQRLEKKATAVSAKYSTRRKSKFVVVHGIVYAANIVVVVVILVVQRHIEDRIVVQFSAHLHTALNRITQ
jgi:hypothetical protein